MPVLTFYRHGLKAGTPPGVNSHQRAKRDVVGGWSNRSIRSNTEFLYSVDESGLTGEGCAITLTVRDCPPSSEDWHRARKAFFFRLRRMGLLRMHWVTEWQRRGVPHLHAALYFPRPPESERGRFYGSIFDHWLAIAEPFGAQLRGQHFCTIHDAMGWFRYVSKHAARGLRHYQRSPESVPAQWQQKTGRMWGHVGDWPRDAEVRVDVQREALWAFRRIVRNWRMADAREAGNRRRIVSARKMLQCPLRELSAVRGVSEWINRDEGLLIVAQLAAAGYEVRS